MGLLPIEVVQVIITTCADFTSQCIIVRINHSSCIYHPFYSPKSLKIYRCWIVWGRNIRIVIIPSFLAITVVGQSIYLHLISRFQFIASSYLAGGCSGSGSFSKLCSYVVYNRFDRVHDRECPGDGHDRVQDPQGHGSYA